MGLEARQARESALGCWSGEKHPLSGRKHSRKGYLESAGPPQCSCQIPSYLSLGELSFCHVQRYPQMYIHDAARLSQACPLPKKNHTEENSSDLQIPSLTLHMKKQAEQEGAYASSSDKSVTGRPGTVRASPHSASVGHTEIPCSQLTPGHPLCTAHRGGSNEHLACGCSQLAGWHPTCEGA